MIKKSKIESLLRSVQKNRARAKDARKKVLMPRTNWCLLRGRELALADMEKRLKKLLK